MKIKYTMRKKQRGGSSRQTTTQSGSENGFIWAVGEHDGYKSPSEDRYNVLSIGNDCLLMAVFDGHGGSTSAEFMNRNLPKRIKARIENEGAVATATLEKILSEEFVLADNDLKRSKTSSGSTGSVAIITPTHIVAANVGDSPILYFTSKGELLFHSIDHHCNNVCELKRIDIAGGRCGMRDDNVMALADNEGIPSLMVTRAFGDFIYKPIAISKPDTYTIERQPNTYLIVCSDSFTERFVENEVNPSIKNIAKPQEVIDAILPTLSKGSLKKGVHDSVEAQVKRFFFPDEPVNRQYSGDNTTLLAVQAVAAGGRVRKGKTRNNK